MKITVCIPLYNGEHCVESALKSLELQTRKPDEVIIRDDCSIDNGKEIVSRFTGLNINLYSNEVNLGLVGNWNKCLEDSNGDIVTFLHQDDGFEPKFLEQVEKDFAAYPNELGMWTCETFIKNSPIQASLLFASGLQHGQESIEKIFTWEDIPMPTGVSFRRSALLDVGFYNPEFECVAEADLYFRLVLKGYSIYKSEKHLVWRTLPETRATTTFGGTNLYYNDWLNFLEKYSKNDKLVSNNMIVSAFSHFCDRASSSVASHIFRSRYGEAFSIIKTILSRGKDFEKLYGLKNTRNLKFLFLIIKNGSKIVYFFFRRHSALIYRRINQKVAN